MTAHGVRRGLALATGCAAFALVVFPGVPYVLLMAAITADGPGPTAADGDPCCERLDTWGEVASGAGWTAAAALVGLVRAVVLARPTRDPN